MINLTQYLDPSRLGNQSTVIESDKALRIAIGVLGIILAPATWLLGVLFGDISLLPSISDYYHTNAEDFFVGILFLVGVFQMSYRGHLVADNLFTWLTGILALVIAIFPCSPPLNIPGIVNQNLSDGIGLFNRSVGVSNTIHLSSAISFFVLISIYVLVFFRRGRENPSVQKKRKNRAFTFCGYGMLILVTIMGAIFFFNKSFFQQAGSLFFFEFGLLLLFGIAWIVKANIVPGFIDEPVKK